ncbi:MAG: twin-arginine translocase TatA/TatE family subunit [Deltaproteobacteria bacterium]|nr:twin-arginine translocase TatA/TatE family subunit [Deltaproteobacteria bacterium]MDZ4224439.1 twin-arginine translocase TatA/TatE family subunit [bacterium]
MRIGWTEILVILGIILLLFGAKRLPELARSLGKSMKEFKKGTQDVMDDKDKEEKDKDEKKPT